MKISELRNRKNDILTITLVKTFEFLDRSQETNKMRTVILICWFVRIKIKPYLTDLVINMSRNSCLIKKWMLFQLEL